ncbi:triphosphoribosyl-dephospho-CoA synthase [Sulfolobus tengchongensis]|uniref:Triphosphoribosyl-dephospho-CoA synthase n=1 Tax=Sulfolobus tengchongensis TaxID=207809 RepID=A0AAX4KZ46_9CREN
MLEDTLNLCNEIAYILAQASLVESYVFKPGNASRFQDLANVKYIDLVRSATLSSQYYRELCVRRVKGIKRIYDTLYDLVIRARRLGFEYQLFGTYMLLAPIAYESIAVKDVFSLKRGVGYVLKRLGTDEAGWFIKALRELSLTYLGKLSSMDYREIENIDFFKLMEFSSKYDILALNITNEYFITFEAYKIIKERKCGFENDIQRAFIRILSEYPDTLIFKKYGASVALKVSKFARMISDCPSSHELNLLNEYLVENRFNPGSTADLIASALGIYYLDEWYKKNNFDSRFSM